MELSPLKIAHLGQRRVGDDLLDATAQFGARHWRSVDPTGHAGRCRAVKSFRKPLRIVKLVRARRTVARSRTSVPQWRSDAHDIEVGEARRAMVRNHPSLHRRRHARLAPRTPSRCSVLRSLDFSEPRCLNAYQFAGRAAPTPTASPYL